ncbi:MAG: alpha/beta hydrolase [Candidatus Bathyarchaeia archaeon]
MHKIVVKMPFVNVDGTKTFYRVVGEGHHPILFIHGAACNSLLWKLQLKHFGKKYRAIAIDLMGHGKSALPIPPSKISINQYADFVKKFLEALNIEGATIIGNSMGGAIAIQFCLNHPEKVISLGLVGTGAKLRVHPQLLQMLRENFQNALATGFENMLGGSGNENNAKIGQAIIKMVLKADPIVGLADFEACNAFDARESLHQIRKPTLIVGGSKDALTPPWFHEYLHKKIENSILKIIDGAGHFPMVEKPREFNAILAEFLEMAHPK